MCSRHELAPLHSLPIAEKSVRRNIYHHLIPYSTRQSVRATHQFVSHPRTFPTETDAALRRPVFLAVGHDICKGISPTLAHGSTTRTVARFASLHTPFLPRRTRYSVVKVHQPTEWLPILRTACSILITTRAKVNHQSEYSYKYHFNYHFTISLWKCQ